MSDLEGLDAFNVVLDRLVTAERAVATIEEKRQYFGEASTRLQRELDQEISARKALIRVTSANLVKLKELHDAVMPYVSEHAIGTDQSDRLKKAWSDAAEACGSDDIPF